jgi:hypothetical protein
MSWLSLRPDIDPCFSRAWRGSDGITIYAHVELARDADLMFNRPEDARAAAAACTEAAEAMERLAAGEGKGDG